MSLTIQSTLRLNNGVEIPRLGLGTFKAQQGDETYQSVMWALEAGYRHFDTASFYANEESIGKAVSESGVPRSEIFLVTKIWNSDQGYDNTLRALDVSLEKLGSDYIDLYLIHWPLKDLRQDTWKALLHLQEEGRCRAIGVSNYTIRHLNELLADSPIAPAANQIEFNPFLYRQELMDFCQGRDIAVEAYCPLARARKLEDPRLVAIAQRCGKSPAQVAIRWALQHGLVVIPKSVHRERIFENAAVFDFALSPADMQELDSLNENFWVIHPTWNPETSPQWE
jgi:diketogulonate reductase-like aldo/keto reductase